MEVSQALAVALWLLVPGLGLRAWLLEGRGWAASLSWTVPLACWLVLDLNFVRPPILATIGYFAGVAFMSAMVVSDRAIAAWFRFVLRRPFPR